MTNLNSRQLKKRVVVTGIGVVTPVGIGTESFWSSLKLGTCGINFIQSYDASNEKVKVAAEVSDFDPLEHFNKKSIGRMDRFVQLGVVAAREAVLMSGLNLEALPKDRFGVSTGTGVGGLGTVLEESEKLIKQGLNFVSPLLVPKFLPNILAGNIAIEFGATGPSHAVITACAAGTDAIGTAMRAIQYGDADVMIAGAAEACVNPLMIAGFTNMNALSQSTDPLKAAIPFDVNRNGFVIGEGSGMLILESLEHALARQATILCELTGYGQTTDAYHLTASAPGGIGAQKAMKLAIENAGLSLEDISAINAHGTSTPINDKNETDAICTLFGDLAVNLPVHSTKSLIGHLQGAAGAVEAVVCTLSLMHQYLHVTHGTELQDAESPLDHVLGNGRSAKLNHILSNSFGFGGHNGTLVFSKYQD